MLLTNNMSEQTNIGLRITPISFVSPLFKTSESNFCFVFKFGNIQTKSSALNMPAEININVVVSGRAEKYEPIKGIIKIFQIDKNKNEILAAVGACNIEGIRVKGKQHYKQNFKIGENSLSLKFQLIESSALTHRTNDTVNISRKSPHNLNRQSGSPKFSKDQRVSEYDCQEQPILVDDSNGKIENLEDISVSYCSEFSEDIKQDERNYLGQQLVEERRKYRAIQQRLEKSNLKNIMLKKALHAKKIEVNSYLLNFKKFTESLEADYKGQYIFEMDERKRSVTIKFRNSDNFQENFEQFLNFMAHKIREKSVLSSSQHLSENQLSNTDNLQEYDDMESHELQRKSSSQRSPLTKQFTAIKSKLFETKKQLDEKQSIIHKLTYKVKRLEEDYKSLEGMNQYLQEKDKQMENIINIKENTIQNLKKMIDDHNNDMDALQQKNSNLYSTINNLELSIEEYKEEAFNLNEVIEGYRKKYGDLKIVKNKAIEMEIKECLRWIDQQTTKEEEIGILNQNQNVLDSLDDPDQEFQGVSSIVKKINHFENLTQEDISSIRKQVLNVLKKLDQLIKRQ